MNHSLKSRLLRTDLGAWNSPWYVYVGTPVFAALGATIGSLWGPHLASGELTDALVIGGAIGVTMLLGFTLLAVVDRRSGNAD